MLVRLPALAAPAHAWGAQSYGIIVASADASARRLVRYVDKRSGHDLEPVAIDNVTGAKLGLRPFQVIIPKQAN